MRGCCPDNADIVSFSLGHNWRAFLRDMDFCGPPQLADGLEQDTNWNTLVYISSLLWIGSFYFEALSLL